ncbi:hypothetical protein HDU85_000345 [Gaertneriomyces sp. JEL0708]|nr:hypothetical protein HDU85_000345 [Gaertneriomyces sp. JEL0708]
MMLGEWTMRQNHASPSHKKTSGPRPYVSSPLSPKPRTSSMLSSSSSPSSTWRDRFKDQCMRRIKDSRKDEVWKKRLWTTGGESASTARDGMLEDELSLRVVRDEWQRFQREGEMQAEVPLDIEEQILQELREEMRHAIHDEELLSSFESSTAEMQGTYSSPSASLQSDNKAPHQCFVCQLGHLTSDGNVIKCTSCPMRAENIYPGTAICVESFIAHLWLLCQQHSLTCSGQPLFTFNHETGLLMLCSVCDECQIIG